ncbi:hypothetical protein QYE76_052529 [Lolium multiflorum]|uniref:Transposase (putative) gypsy type domain-containing protein n=1 Tax=Lolium multiflorum TaxID=4521 RepID=A0AAD8SUW8_LOLMU|nr:hypothetical protein QYE76_052529 [Lolium multiflorum]
MELSGSSRVSEEIEISWSEEDPVYQEASGPEEEIEGLEEEAGPSSAAYSRGRCIGSDVTEAEIEWLYRSRRIPEGVTCRIPEGELEPVVRSGEIVVFAAHFERGLGLPASDFFRRFLNFYKLEPHHLPGNAIFYLSSFVSFMEGYVGLWPTIETFSRFYNLRINSVQDPKLPLPKSNFSRISAEVPESYTPSRTEEDQEDPDPFRTSNRHATDSSRTMGSGNSSAFPSSKPRANESGSEEDDCVILEVLDPLPISYALFAMPVSADSGRQVLEHVMTHNCTGNRLARKSLS